MKIVYFGTPHFAAHILSYLIEQGVDVAAVVTNPDKPSGRGHKLRPSAVKEVALTHHLPILQPESLQETAFQEALKALRADLFIVIAFRLMPRAIWDMPRLGTFNLHASLLPHYRGAAPIQHAILNGERYTGVTTFLLNEGIDEGKILLQEKIDITPYDTGGTLHDKLMQLGAEVTLRTIQGLAEGSITPKPQGVVEGLKYATKIYKEDRYLFFQKNNAKELALRVRAMSPYPAAIARLGSEEIKIFSAREFNLDHIENRLQPGEYCVIEDELVIKCKEGALGVQELQFPNKRPSTIRDYLHGNQLPEGELFQ